MRVSKFLFFGFLCFTQIIFAQVKITTFAPNCVNQHFYFWRYEDFISNRLQLIKDTVVNDAGIFSLNLPCNKIEKIVLGTEEEFAYMYIQPKGKYNVEFIAESAQHSSYDLKEEIELTFYNLDSNDINYKILGYHAWIDNYMADIFVEQNTNPKSFASKIAIMKLMIAKDIQNDTSSYFDNFMRYTMANDIDDQRFIGAPSQDEKYAIYLENRPILYDCDTYIDYFKSFYNQYIAQLETTRANELFAAFAANDLMRSDTVLKNCPHANNPELRSLLRIYILEQALYGNFIPKSLIYSNLKRIALESDYPMHRSIAQNVLNNQSYLQQGSPFIFEELNSEREHIQLNEFSNKYIYLHAFNPSNTLAISELNALKKLYKSYGSKIEFVTLYVDKTNLNESEKRAMDLITWKKVGFKLDDPLWDNLGIYTYPYYILIDKDLTVVASPALSPTPNGKYETIEKTMFDIAKP